MAHLGGPEPFGQLLWGQAQSRGWKQYFDSQVIGDGATWIWNLTNQHFFDSLQTIDWYHACQHLHTAAQAFYPDKGVWAQCWYRQAKTTLFQGSVDKIVTALRTRAQKLPRSAEVLATETGYFQNNKRRMDYFSFREEGYLIGSGTVESGAEQFKARFSGPGMRWSRLGLVRLLPIRSAVMSRSFDALWPQVYFSPHN